MADSTQSTNKIVEYKIVGDNTNLINSVTSAIKKLDALDVKLKRIATKKDISVLEAKQARNATNRIASITKATNDLIKIRNILNTTNVDYLNSAQIALIKTAKQEISNLADSLGKARSAGSVTQATLDNVSKTVHTLQQSFKNAGIQIVDYDAIAKEQAQNEKRIAAETAAAKKKAEKEKAAAAKEQARIEKQTAKEAIAAEKERITFARRSAQEYQQLIQNTIRTITSIVNTLRNAARIIYELMNFSADYYETMNKFNVIAGESTETLSKYVEEMHDALGLDYKDLYDAISSFKSISNNISLSTEQAETFSTTMTSLAIDLASLHNKSVEQALNALHAGLNGLQKPLQAFDIYLYEANLEQTALQHNIGKSVSAMNQSEKILLRYLAILDQSTSAQGDMARTITSTANQIKIAQAQFTQLKRSLGQIATAISITVLPVLNILMSAATKLFTFLARSLGYEIENLANLFQDDTDATDDATNALTEYENAAKNLSDLDEINLISNDSNILDTETGALAIDENLLKALHSYDNGIKNISKTMDDLADKIANALNNTLASTLFEAFAKGLKLLGESFAFVVNNWEIFEPIIKTFINLLTILTGIAIGKTIAGWTSKLVAFAKTFSGFALTLPTKMKTITGSLLSTTEAVTKTTLAFSALTFAMAQAVASAIFDQLEGEQRQLIATMSALASTLITTAMAMLALQGVMTWGTAIPIITASIGVGLASFQALFNSEKQSTLSFSLGETMWQGTQMASGGVVDQPTIAMIGEGRYNEAVVPLGNSPQFTEMKMDIAAEVARKISPTPSYTSVQLSSGQTPVVLRIDGRDLARALLPYIGYVQPQTGVKLV